MVTYESQLAIVCAPGRKQCYSEIHLEAENAMPRKLPELLCLLALILELGTATAQQTSQPEPNPIPASPQESAGQPEGGARARQMANANNPLADMNALQFQNYFTPTFYGVSNVTSNIMNLRGVLVSGRMIFPATLPTLLCRRADVLSTFLKRATSRS